MDRLLGKNSRGASGRIFFCGDCHGQFDHVIEAVQAFLPAAIILLGDMEAPAPLDQILAPILESTEVWWIHGNHDTDRESSYDHLFGSALADRNLHGRVFDDSFDQVWKEGLSLGIRDAGYEPYRIKEDIHNEKIDFRIVAAIRSCRFLVAEVSEPRTAVYYEAGFAEGLGKQVIWTCREDCLKNLSFDTRQFRHVVWREPQMLRADLCATVKALMPSV